MGFFLTNGPFVDGVAPETLENLRVFAPDGTELSQVALTLSNCFDSAGNLDPWANEIRSLLKGYAQKTLDGTGITIVFAITKAMLERLEKTQREVDFTIKIDSFVKKGRGKAAVEVSESIEKNVGSRLLVQGFIPCLATIDKHNQRHQITHFTQVGAALNLIRAHAGLQALPASWSAGDVKYVQNTNETLVISKRASKSGASKTKYIDFKAVAATAQPYLAQILNRLVPGGYVAGDNFYALNPTRIDHNIGSFNFTLTTGIWCDRAMARGSGAFGRDIVSYAKYVLQLDTQSAAAHKIAELTADIQKNGGGMPEVRGSISRKSKSAKKVEEGKKYEFVAPVPDNAPGYYHKLKHFSLGEAVAVFEYYTLDGKIHHYVARFEPTTTESDDDYYRDTSIVEPEKRKKEFLPITLWRDEAGKLLWRWAGPDEDLKILYGLDTIALNPDSPVYVVEGEKKVDAITRLFRDVAAVSGTGGAKGAKYMSWEPLRGKTVILCPDADDAGEGYVETVAKILARLGCKLKLVDTAALLELSENPTKIQGYDIADAVDEWPDLNALGSAVLEHTSDYEPPNTETAATIKFIRTFRSGSTLWLELRFALADGRTPEVMMQPIAALLDSPHFDRLPQGARLIWNLFAADGLQPPPEVKTWKLTALCRMPVIADTDISAKGLLVVDSFRGDESDPVFASRKKPANTLQFNDPLELSWMQTLQSELEGML